MTPQDVSASRALVGVGSNLGDRDAHVGRAVDLLSRELAVEVLAISRTRTTAPVGGPPQPEFRNAALLLRTTLTPRELLHVLQRIERDVGRTPGGLRWGPRVIDLDVLLFDDRVVQEPGLHIPHPRMPHRRFVLEPAAEIAPDMRHPALECTVRELLEALP